MKYKQDELEAGLAELKGMCNNLEERLAYTESEKEVKFAVLGITLVFDFAAADAGIY